MTGLTCDFMDFTDSSLSLDPCDVNNHIETAFDLFLNSAGVRVGIATQGQSSHAVERFGGAAGVDRRQGSSMACVHRVEQSPRFRPAYFAHDNPIWSVPEDGSE